MGQSTFLLRLTWTENIGEISLFDYGNCKTWKGQVYTCKVAHSTASADYYWFQNDAASLTNYNVHFNI